ncbi:transglutaminase domain-containing protein [Alteromonas sp. 345S023]|uniref:Transglutaminase domain-containing protein n=1 Tax=Alteromonas profundi TaxID=2696062 RepID=A0A7X5LL52_9ALTE|nr:transglutaminase-like domain-containing protein [Alteromonas profundi]NDV91372.1 transglutaminase domain-containing protein [Alteromonas profundi]
MKAIIFFTLLTFVTFVHSQSDPSFATVDVTLDNEQNGPLGQRISLSLLSSNAKAIAAAMQQWQGIQVDAVTDSSLTITTELRPRYMGEVKPQYSAATFVIDLDEPSTKGFTSGFVPSDEAIFSVDEVQAYVSEYISDATYIHGFNFASTVAKQKSGDCTEFAVLTTALVRALGKPGRVVFGTVLIDDPTGVTAYGHAWTEVFDNGNWQIIDAALYGLAEDIRFYLPGSVIENEGPGYGMSLAAGIMLMPSKLANVKTATL